MSKNKSLITDEIIKMVQAAVKVSPNITRFEPGNNKTIRLGSVKVNRVMDNGKPVVTLYLDDDVENKYNNIWRNDLGNILIKEMKKSEPLLFELNSAHFKALMKEITEDEIEKFLDNGKVHMKIGDKAYTIIKVIKLDEDYFSKEMYSDYGIEKEEYKPEEVPTKMIPTIDELAESENEISSYSLF